MFSFHFCTTLVLFILSQVSIAATASDSNWWKSAVFYQIYPRSFKDSDNDGIGDLKGIISKLSHLQDAGVTAAWLSPIYKSPQVDQGYDISSFTEIDEDYGSMADFEALITAAHQKGIKIIMDFVPNHSSNLHDWFKLSENKTVGFEDYYVWADGANGAPPNNWISIFKNSAWKFSATRGQYYLHQFTEEQPDLNYRSSGVVKQMKDVLTFWLKKGVDGFRMDAVPMLFEDQWLKNEPRSNTPNAPSHMTSYLQHIYTQDQPETFDMIQQWRTLLDEYSNTNGGDARIMMTESYTNIYDTMYYYGNEGAQGAHFTFNFFLITDLNKGSTAGDIAFAVEKWLKDMPARYTANWVLGNHDNNRVATRFGPGNVDGYNMLVALLPGIMVTYNGEEIGQEDGKVTFAQGKDPNALNGPEEDFEKTTRDVERTPFQWDTSTNAGFNTGGTPWLPVSEKYKSTNLASQQDPSVPSHFQIYKQLIKLRKQDAFKSGTLKIKAVTDNVLVFSRSLEGSDSYVVIINIGPEEVTVSIDKLFATSNFLEVVIPSVTSSRKKEDLVSAATLSLTAYESLVLIKTSRVATNPPTTSTSTTQATQKATSSALPETTTSMAIATAPFWIAFVLCLLMHILS